VKGTVAAQKIAHIYIIVKHDLQSYPHML
jgi:hypothetical protein